MFPGKKEGVKRGVAAALTASTMVVGTAQADEAARAEVKGVSDTFYAAVNEMLDGTPVSATIAPLWVDADGVDAGGVDAGGVDAGVDAGGVTAQHPIGGRDTGLDAILAAFDGVASLASGGELTLQDQAIAVFGATAVETGVEFGKAVLAGEEIDLSYRVTNVYVLTEAGWRMVHHHTDPSAPLIDLVARLSN